MGIMALSSKAANGLQNGYKYNGISEEDNFDLDLYDAYYRTLDPQLGRWWQIDPMATSFPGISGYSSAFNSPVNLSDPLGDCPTCPGDGKEGDVWNYMGQLYRNIAGQWIGSGPETVVTASLLSNFLRHDVLNQRFVSSGFWQLTNRPGNELPYLRGQIPISIEPISGPDRTKALFTHYKTPQERAREATIDYYKDVDFAHGQLMQARSVIWDIIFGARKALNGEYVGPDGYPLSWAQQAIQRQADYDIALFSIIGGPGKVFGGAGLLEDAVRGTTTYTKSSLSLGRKMHKAYRLAEHAPELGRFKGFGKIKEIRPDFIDFNTRTIYELKPFNPRAMKKGWNQLNKYKSIFEQRYGGEWKTVLDTY